MTQDEDSRLTVRPASGPLIVGIDHLHSLDLTKIRPRVCNPILIGCARPGRAFLHEVTVPHLPKQLIRKLGHHTVCIISQPLNALPTFGHVQPVVLPPHHHIQQLPQRI
jgi:hypothetical protein